MIRKTLVGLGALSLMATPVMAEAAVRDAAPITADAEQLENSGAWPVLLAALALAAGAIFLVVDEDDDEDVDLPTSP